MQKLTLLVEGHEDLLAIAELMGKHTTWSNDKNLAPVKIKCADGINNMLKPEFIGVNLKERDMKATGIVVDADDNFQLRWRQIKEQCVKYFPNIPNEIPPEGLICDNSDGQRLGIWLMPNNASPGMLETFLSNLIPKNDIWKHAIASTQSAKTKGAPYKSAHEEKAKIHTYLAWQDPPGDNFRIAISKNTLNPMAESAKPFVHWFLKLFELPPLDK